MTYYVLYERYDGEVTFTTYEDISKIKLARRLHREGEAFDKICKLEDIVRGVIQHTRDCENFAVMNKIGRKLKDGEISKEILKGVKVTYYSINKVIIERDSLFNLMQRGFDINKAIPGQLLNSPDENIVIIK